MSRLGMWASTYDCAIVLIGHLNKKEGTKGLYRSLGSIDVVATARSVMQVERHIDNPDIRIVRQIKNSLGPSGGEIWFEINADTGFKWLEPGQLIQQPELSTSLEEPEFQNKLEYAAYLIKNMLSDGDVLSKEAFERLSDKGVGRKTVEEAKKILGIKSYRKMRQWYWSLDGRKKDKGDVEYD